jgi:phosphate transport system permease protein
VFFLGEEALRFFTYPEVSLLGFLTGTKWQPQIGQFGILPLLTATLMSSTIAMVVALPLGLCVAIYLSEYATPKMRNIIKPSLEILAGIPTIVLGYFALTFVTPMLQGILGKGTVQVYNVFAAGVVMDSHPAIDQPMTEDALSAVPNSLREGAYGLGATKLEVATQIVVPAALSGIAAAVILGISRAVGEAMIVAIAAGAGPRLTLNPFQPAETMTGHIVRISGGDLSFDSVDYNSLFAIALLLFIITLILNLLSQRIIQHFREVYE